MIFTEKQRSELRALAEARVPWTTDDEWKGSGLPAYMEVWTQVARAGYHPVAVLWVTPRSSATADEVEKVKAMEDAVRAAAKKLPNFRKWEIKFTYSPKVPAWRLTYFDHVEDLSRADAAAFVSRLRRELNSAP